MRVGMADEKGVAAEMGAEDEAGWEGSQMVGGWADWMGRKREREGWLSRHGRSGVDEVRGKGRGGWFPCLASRNRYAGGNLAPPTPPTPYVIAPPNDRNPSSPASPRLLPFSPRYSSSNFQPITHLWDLRDALTSLLLHASSIRVFYHVEMLQNCLNCVRERTRCTCSETPKIRITSREFYQKTLRVLKQQCASRMIWWEFTMYYKESYVLNKSDINMTLHILLITNIYIVPINICFLLSCIFCAKCTNVR